MELPNYLAPKAVVAPSDDDSDEGSDISDDEDITAMDDLGPEYGTESDYEYPDSDEDLPDDAQDSVESSDEWDRNAYASGDESESDTEDIRTRVTHGVRRKA